MEGHGPFKIRIMDQIYEDPGAPAHLTLHVMAGEHQAWCNDHGAVFIKVGEKTLGVRPHEFEYVTLPPAGVPLALTPRGARKLVDEILDHFEITYREGYCDGTYASPTMDRAKLKKSWLTSKAKARAEGRWRGTTKPGFLDRLAAAHAAGPIDLTGGLTAEEAIAEVRGGAS